MFLIFLKFLNILRAVPCRGIVVYTPIPYTRKEPVPPRALDAADHPDGLYIILARPVKKRAAAIIIGGTTAVVARET